MLADLDALIEALDGRKGALQTGIEEFSKQILNESGEVIGSSANAGEDGFRAPLLTIAQLKG
ncbi:MAG: hypothetical protein KAS38_15045, partial [Anaerolineales bacterium]|nr:hypothetical protein [Anaerolineales bacterium]